MPAKPLPAEVINLPAILAKPISAREQHAALKRRDELMKLHGQGARLSGEEQILAHAHTRIGNYEQELDRLKTLLAAKRRPRGILKAECQRRLKATVDLLAEAMCDAGQFEDAMLLLNTHLLDKERKRSPRFREIVRMLFAIRKPDDHHCKCPPENKTTRKRVFLPQRGRFCEVIECVCGHLNVTEVLPKEVRELREARADIAAGRGNRGDTAVAARMQRKA